MEDRIWQLIEQGWKDAKQWIADAPTPEIKYYRLKLAVEAFTSGKDMHYYRDGLDNQIVAGNWTPQVSLPTSMPDSKEQDAK